MEAQPLRIGALARSAGVGIETIRYYQRRGLLGTPPKPLGGQRLYPAQYAERLRFIKRGQALGFALEDVAVLLQLNDGTGHVRARQLATRRLDEIESRLADLAAIRDVLRELIRRCAHADGRVPCPIIATLAAETARPAKSGRARPGAR
jgi:MerR family mercuric resistance operon transcriptional regulator